MAEDVFERREIKYVLTPKQYADLIQACGDRLMKNNYYESFIQSLYFDTDSFELIRNALEGVPYREKFRVRSYSDFSDENVCFLEVKKKYLGKTYKRRVSLLGAECKQFLTTGEIPKRILQKPTDEKQIMEEMRYSILRLKTLRPRCLLRYHRFSYMLIDGDLPPADAMGLPRLTFDDSIFYGANFGFFNDLTDDNVVGSASKQTELASGAVLMEYKGDKRMPLWFVHILSDLKITPGSFSKYGTAYKEGKLFNGQVI